jgi:hypothetical protein
MPPPIIATIASSGHFNISTGGSEYKYPIILNSNGASLASQSNADGNGSSFGHFYKNLLSSSTSLVMCNVSSFINTCNFAMDSTATVSLWTSTGKYLRVPLVGPTIAEFRTDMIAKEGIIINTVSTQNAYSTTVGYFQSEFSSFIFKEGTYSTILAADPIGNNIQIFTFPDAVYLNLHKYGASMLMSTTAANYNSLDEIITFGLDWYCNSSDHLVIAPLSASSPSIFRNVWSDTYIIPPTISNWSLHLQLTMCNLDPTTFYRLSDSNQIAAIAYPSYCNFSNVTICNFNAIQFPGGFSSYLSNSSDLKYYNSGSVCVFSKIDPMVNEGIFPLFNFGEDYNYDTDSKHVVKI